MNLNHWKYLIILGLSLISSQCVKWSEKCHLPVVLVNSTIGAVAFCTPDDTFDGNKVMRIIDLNPGERYELFLTSRSTCLEHKYQKYGFEYYYANTEDTTLSEFRIPKDSIWADPLILQSGVLSSDDLIDLKFILEIN